MYQTAIVIAAVLLLAASAMADPTPFPADPDISTLVSQIDQDNLNEIVNTLVDFHTRHTYSDTISDSIGIGAAREWVRDQYVRQGVDAELFHWNGNWGGSIYDCYNVKATLNGQTGRPDLIILGGHLDSRAVSSSDTASFAPGADDDGSSVAAMMEIARVLQQEPMNTTLVTSSFAGEEQGLLGSQAYAQSLANSSTPVKAMLNMDMIGHIVFPGGAIDSMTVRCYSGGPMSSSSRQLARYVKWIGEAYADGVTVTLYDAIDRPGRSGDHVSFYNAGYPAIRLIETAEDVAYQHGPNDVPENMSFSYARKITKLCMGVAVTLAQTPGRPPAPQVENSGNGTSLIVSWPDSLGGTIRIAYRATNQLCWENVVETNNPPPYQIDGLTEGIEYCISLSLSSGTGLPGPFGDETTGIPVVAPPPENFETTSTPTSVELTWTPRPEATITEYVIYRTEPGGVFATIATVPHPDSTFSDVSPITGQMYLYQIKTRNDEGILGAPTEIEEGQLATHHLNLLLIDATPDGPGGVSAPPDEDVDQFYQTATNNFAVEADWDRADSMAASVTISDADLAPYSIVLVYADYQTASISDDTTAFRKYIDNGGKLIISGWRLSYVLDGYSGYEHTLGAGDFLYDLAGIDAIQVVQPPAVEFIGATGALGYPDVDFDAVSFPGWGGALVLAEAIFTDPLPTDIDVIADFEAASGAGSIFDGQPVAVRKNNPIPPWTILDFPLYYMTPSTSIPFLEMILTDMGAPPVGLGEEDNTIIPQEFAVADCYPNPFNPNVAISIQLSAFSHVTLSVYDTSGKKVATLIDGFQQAGSHEVTFDGTGLASGIYIYRLEAGDFRGSGKIVLLK